MNIRELFILNTRGKEWASVCRRGQEIRTTVALIFCWWWYF